MKIGGGLIVRHVHSSLFIDENIEPGSHVITDGWKGYEPLDEMAYRHHQVIQNKANDKVSVRPGGHLIAFLVKRVILGTHQGRFGPGRLQSYLDEYVFRFNRRGFQIHWEEVYAHCATRHMFDQNHMAHYQKNATLISSQESSLGVSE